MRGVNLQQPGRPHVEVGSNQSRLMRLLNRPGVSGQVRYEVGDLSTLYQDSYGVSPVTGVGQRVGLILDKSKGLALGPERVVNGDFANGLTEWEVSGADVDHSVTTSAAGARYRSAATSPVLTLFQRNVFVIGKVYLVAIEVASYVSGQMKMEGSTEPVVIYSAEPFSRRVRGSVTTSLRLLRSTADVDVTIKRVSVREVLGNHAYQGTPAAMPMLGARINVLAATEFLGGVADASPRGGSCSAASGLSGWPLGITTGIAFAPSPSAHTYAYKSLSVPAGVALDFSVIVRMDDGSPPVVSSDPSNVVDFVLVLANATTNMVGSVVTHLGGGVYRVSMGITTAAGGQYFGVVKYTSNSARGFTVSGYQLTIGSGVQPYQRVISDTDYDSVGFPKYLEYDGIDDWMVTTFDAVQPIDRVSAISQVSHTAARYIFSGTARQSTMLYQGPNSPDIAIFAGAVGVIAPGPAVGVPSVVTEHYEGAGSKVAVDNGAYTVGNAGVDLPDGLTIGARFTQNANGNFRLYSLVQCSNGGLSDSDIEYLRGVARDSYKITAKDPVA